jgi:Replication-relaxation
MDAITPKSRLSRWVRDPVRDELGKPTIATLTQRDIDIFKLLSRYPYLPFTDIHAFIGGGKESLSKRINLLYRRPNLYLDRPHQQRIADANYRSMIYELDDKGRQVLADRGLPHVPKKYHRNFAHELMACRIMLSFELGVRANKHLRLIHWPEIIAKMSPTAQNADEPHAIPVTFHSHGKTHSKHIKADWKPFGIERIEGGKSFYCFFPGIEADTGTEPVESTEFRSDISQKFAAYLAVCKDRIHQSHYGLPGQGFFIPFITGSKTRMENMMTLFSRMTNGKGHPSFVFKTFPPITSFQKPPPPSGDMLTTPWLRVGYPPLKLKEEK